MDQQFHFRLELEVMVRGVKQAGRACQSEGSVPYLVALEEGRDFQGLSNGLQSVPVGDLRTEMVRVSYTLCVGMRPWCQIYVVH